MRTDAKVNHHHISQGETIVGTFAVLSARKGVVEVIESQRDENGLPNLTEVELGQMARRIIYGRNANRGRKRLTGDAKTA